MRRVNLYVSLLAYAVALTSQAQAGVVLYNQQSSFIAATTNLTTVNFNGLAPPGDQHFFGFSFSVGGVSFSDEGGTLLVIDPGYAGGTYAFSSGHQVLVDNFGGGAGLTVGLPSGVNAVSLLVGDTAPAAGTITLSSGEIINFDITGNPTLDFVGFTSTTSIRSFSFQDDIQSPVLDTLRYGQTAVPTPEPSTVIAAALGGLLIVAVRRHRLI